MKRLFFLLILFLPATGAFAEEAPPPVIIHKTIFKVISGVVSAPLATHSGSQPKGDPTGYLAGWTAATDDDYYSFEAGLLDTEHGALEIDAVIVHEDLLKKLGDELEALVTIYDENNVPIFSVGLNDHDVAVGSYMLHPMIMEDVFGGVGFHYSTLLGGPPDTGALINIKVEWGRKPADDRVYVNGKLIGIKSRRGPRNHGKFPGFEPVKTFDSFMHGFTTFDARVIGPARTITVGKLGKVEQIKMYPPHAVAIKRVTLVKVVEPPTK